MSNESVDQHVREALDSLPDTRPPGSTFDAGAMWKTIQAKLQPKPRRRRAGWWVAACLILVIASVASFFPESSDDSYLPEQSVIVRRTVPVPRPEQPYRTDASETVVKTVPTPSKSIRRQSTSATPAPTFQPEIGTVPIPEESPVPEPAPVAEVVAEGTSAKAVPVPTRSRFRVLHVNELQAEEAARPRLYRSEGLVRVIFGAPLGAESSVQEPVKSVTFSTKSNPIP